MPKFIGRLASQSCVTTCRPGWSPITLMGEIVGNDDCRDSASPYSAACSPGASGATTTRRVLRAFAPDRGHGVG